MPQIEIECADESKAELIYKGLGEWTLTLYQPDNSLAAEVTINTSQMEKLADFFHENFATTPTMKQRRY